MTDLYFWLIVLLFAVIGIVAAEVSRRKRRKRPIIMMARPFTQYEKRVRRLK